MYAHYSVASPQFFASPTILVTNLCLASLVWSHLRLRLRQKRIQAIGHKNNFFLSMFDFGIFVELCSSLFLEKYAGIGQMT